METNSVVFFQANSYPEVPSKPIVAVWKIKNPQNVGNLIRMVDNVGGEELFILDDESPKREASVKKTAGLSYAHVKVNSITSDNFWEIVPEGYSVCAIETSEGSENIFRTNLPGRIVFLLGSESHGLPPGMIAKCDHVIHIPMTGKCKSMNVSHALSVAIFEWVRQQMFS